MDRPCVLESNRCMDLVQAYEKLAAFFFNDTATTEIYTLSLHDALPIFGLGRVGVLHDECDPLPVGCPRSEEHTSELQSRLDLVCRLLREKKETQGSSTTCIGRKGRSPAAHQHRADAG